MLRYIVICSLLTTIRCQLIRDEFDLLLDSLDKIPDTASVQTTETDDGDTFYEFNKTASIPLSVLPFKNKTLHYPFIINTELNLYQAKSSLFSIEDVEETKLRLSFNREAIDSLRINVDSASFPDVITFSLVSDMFSTHNWVKLLFYIDKQSVTFWLNCTTYTQVNITTPLGDIVLSEDATLYLSKSSTDQIMGAIKEIKIHTNADQTTIDTICAPVGTAALAISAETEDIYLPVPGDKGDVGPIGPPGPPGPNGPVGERGLTGETGAKGEQGDKGLKGAEGPRGEKGERGEAGVDGIPGSHGTYGRPGIIGQKGDKGETGATGPAGTPATLTSLLNEDLDPIQNAAITEMFRGLKGQKGDDGRKGDIGDVGPIGPQGTDGNDGRDGALGEIGPIGPKGDQGPIGPSGHKGNTGEPGPPGNVPTSAIELMRGYKGVEGEKGAPGVKGEKGNSAPPIDLSLLKGDKGERGDIGPVGPIGPSGPPGAVSNQTSLPGAPGPPGPPGPPGVSITRPGKGEPAAISNSSFYDFESLGDGDDVYTAATLVYKSRTSLIRQTSSTPLGTLAFVLQEKILLLRVQNGWQYVVMGSLYGDVPDASTTTVEPTLPTRAPTPVVTSASPRRDRLTSNALRLIALNEPYTGTLMSMTNASGMFAVNNDNCTRQSRRYKFSGSYDVFFNYRDKGIQYLVQNSYRHLPVVNLYGDVLFDSWNSLVDGLGGVLPTAANIFSFNGKNIFIDSTWPDKKIWHGGSSVNVRQKANCKDWTSASHKEYGTASPLESNKLLKQEMYPCDSQFIVLCIESVPSVPSDRTSEATEAYAVGQEDEEN